MNYDISSEAFQNSPLANAYYFALYELQERDVKGKQRTWHKSVALWAAWESHRKPKIGEGDTTTDLLKQVGLPHKQCAFAKIAGVSERTLRNYRTKYGDLAIEAGDVGINALLSQYDHSVITALGESASDPHGKNSATDRRTFGNWRGWGNKKQVDVDVKSGGQPLLDVGSIIAAMQQAQQETEADE